MSSEHDAASKTEEATPRRLEEARKEGDVAKSAELAQTCALAGAFAALVAGGPGMAQHLADQLTPFIAHPESMQTRGAAGVAMARQVMMVAAGPLLMVLGAATLAGAGGNVIQHGFLFTPSKLKPDLSKLSPGQGLKRLFGLDGLMSFLRSLLKVLLVGAVAWWVLAPHASELVGLVGMGPLAILGYGMGLSRSLMMAVLALLAAGSLLDYLWQRQRHAQRMRMSKEELKEDYRQSEGDPRVKARQRQIRMERARRRMMQAVPKATVVVMNPTHFAVALRYKQGETPAPECVAKGMDALALKIREVAEAAGVPIIEDPPLARALYSAVEIDEIIPQQHYEAVAKIIGFILSGRKPGRRGLAPARPAMMAR